MTSFELSIKGARSRLYLPDGGYDRPTELSSVTLRSRDREAIQFFGPTKIIPGKKEPVITDSDIDESDDENESLYSVPESPVLHLTI